MKHPYTTYLLAVVLPSTLAVGVTLTRVRSAWEDIRHESDARVAHTTLQVFQQDLGQAVDSLIARAEPAEMDTTSSTVKRALAGDTVTGLSTSGAVPEVFVLAPPHPGGPANLPRLASETLTPYAPAQVGRATGYRVALYLRAKRWTATDGSAGPDQVDPATQRALAAFPGGLSLEPDQGGGALVGLGSDAVALPGVAAWAAPRVPPPGPLRLPLLLVMALLLLFAVLAGWIQLSARGEDRGNTLASLLLVALVPALTAWVFQVQADRLFKNAARQATAGDLTRGLAVASARNVTDFPETVRDLTGFQATVMRDGQVEASTFTMPGPTITTLPAPPGSFTTSGRIVTPEGPSAYVALRTSRGATLVVTAPEPVGRIRDLQRHIRAVGIALATWLVMVGVFLAVRQRPARVTQDSAGG